MQRTNNAGGLFKQNFWYAEVFTVLAFINLPSIAINYFQPENWYVWYILDLAAFGATVLSLRKIRRIEMFKSPALIWEMGVIVIMVLFIDLLMRGVVGTQHGYASHALFEIPSAGISFLAAWFIHRVPEEKTS